METKNYFLTIGSNLSIDELEFIFEKNLGMLFCKRNGSYKGGDYIDIDSHILADKLSIQSNYIPFLETFEIVEFSNYRTLIYVTINKGKEKDKKPRYDHIKSFIIKYIEDAHVIEESVLV